MLNKRVFIVSLICVAIWIVGEVIILNIKIIDTASVTASRVWAIICLIVCILINTIFSIKNNGDDDDQHYTKL